MRRAARAVAGLCCLAAVTPAPSVRADPSGLLQACFAGPELAEKDGEHRSRRAAGRDVAITLADTGPAEAVPRGLRGAIRRVELPPGSAKLIALTLDLCEQAHETAGYDGAVFDYLRREGVKATVFAGGKWMRSHPDRSQQLLADPLFELANHGDLHRNLKFLDPNARSIEILGPQQAYRATRAALSARRCVANMPGALERLPQRLSLFRFPFGACDAAALQSVAAAGMLAIQWDLSTGDPDPKRSAATIADSMVRGARPGSIILAHANGRGWNIASALPLAIPRLKALGFEFVTVSELLAAGSPVITPTCYSLRPGDTDRYGPLGVAPKPVARPAAR